MRRDAQIAIDYGGRGAAWHDDQLISDAIAKRVEQVAELAKYQFPRELRDQYPQIPWSDIAGMRDRLVHDYDQLDRDVLREVVEQHLPSLVATLDKILEAG
jgi:uncharacterized protein with HEPN domain